MKPNFRKQAVHHGVQVKIVPFVLILLVYQTLMSNLVDMIIWLHKWEWRMLVPNSILNGIPKMIKPQSDAYVKKKVVTVIV